MPAALAIPSSAPAPSSTAFLSASSRTVPSDADLIATLRSRFGHPAFRPGQLEAIRRTLGGADQLMVLPTGGGKSLLYQLPASLLPGATLVVSPLVALMEDQLVGLRRVGLPSACLHSGQSPEAQAATLADLAAGRLKVLLVAPERLTTSRLRAALVRTRVGLVAVDEAHCVSEWGHDFRPDYRQLRPILSRLRCPVLAITATATEEVQDDICAALGIPHAVRSVLALDRPNLRFGVRRVRTERERLHALAELAESLGGGSGLVYVPRRAEADDLAFQLTGLLGERVGSYHAGLPADTRLFRQRAYLGGHVRWMVATSAFGMGIDKPDVRMVLHARAPRSLEDYVQEAGRASRDGRPAVCCLISAPGDVAHLHLELGRTQLSPERAEARRRRLGAVEQYVSGRGCRRAAILGYFGSRCEIRPYPCCDACNSWRWAWLW